MGGSDIVMDDFFQNLRVFLSNGDLIDKMFKRYNQIDDKIKEISRNIEKIDKNYLV